MAHRIDDKGAEGDVPVSMLHEGDRVKVPGTERLPIDGMLEHGESSIGQSPFTGESVPVGGGFGTDVGFQDADTALMSDDQVGFPSRSTPLVALVGSSCRLPRVP